MVDYFYLVGALAGDPYFVAWTLAAAMKDALNKKF